VVEGSGEGAQLAKSISYGLIASIARFAMAVRSDDTGPAIEAELTNLSFEKLNGVRFIGKTGPIERGKLRDPNGERYDDKTTIATEVTPNNAKEWEQ
jgi:hypothetical protein